MKREDELVEDVLHGETKSFEILLNSYRKAMLNIAYHMTRNFEDAREICQEALVKIFRHLHRYKKGSNFKNWIYKITVNCALDFMKRKKKEQKIIEDQKYIDPKIHYGPEGQLKNKEIKEKINLYMNTLSPKKRLFFF
ncbi:MAG: RNA polymerase sigma factor [Candidatus Aminicenantaceae bacterium]